MSGFRDRVKGAARRCVLAPDGLVWQIQRVRSADLAQHAVAELVGARYIEEELQRLRAEQKAAEAAWKLEHTPEEQREEAERRKAEQEAHAERMAMRALARSLERHPDLAKDYVEKIDAYVCAGVIAGGEYKGEALTPNYPEEAPIQYVGIVDEADCELSPVSVVLNEADDDEDSGRLWVGWIDETTRGWLSTAVTRLSGAPSARPFRPEPDASAGS